MTVTMEDSQSVVIKKHMPELERLQLKEKRERERSGGGRRRQNSSVTSKAQSENRSAERLQVLLLSAIPPSLAYRAPTLPAALGQVQGVQSWVSLVQGKQCPAGGTSTLNKVGKPIHLSVKRRLQKECGIFKTGTQRICGRSSPGGGQGGASQAKGMAGTKDRGMKQHHSVSQQGGYLQF